MIFNNRIKSAALALGIALFVGLGLTTIIGAEQNNDEALLRPGPIDPAVVAPAEQLSKAFIMVANHVKPAVVSVYSEKKITYTLCCK